MAYGVMAFVFASTTPLGIVIGLAIQTTYNAESPTALAVAGIFDSISSGTPHLRMHSSVNAACGILAGQHDLP